MKLDLFALLQNEIRPALGCTEPAAVALACAVAASYLDGPPLRVEVQTDPNVFKNGMGVFIPGTTQTGLALASALGALARKPELELEVLSGCGEHLAQAQQMVLNQQVSVTPTRPRGGLSILAHVTSEDGQATALIEGSHTHVAKVTVDGVVAFEREIQTQESNNQSASDLLDYSIKELVTACKDLPEQAYKFLIDCALSNQAVAKAGISQQLGLGLGWRYQELIHSGQLNRDLVSLVQTATAGAADARMSGYDAPVYSTNGSGNQGITASLPVLVVGQELHKTEHEIGIALAISQIITIYVKQHIGKLSALCACAVAAAIGSSCGITFLLDAPYSALEETIKLMVANLTGMICDGAKLSCSLKLTTAACTAVQTAMLAKLGMVAHVGDGIIAATAEETLRNLGTVSNPGMIETDNVILNVMMKATN
jgi:L-cysteine desulfidase